MGLFLRRVRRLGDDRFKVELPDAERELLHQLFPQLRELLASDDPSLTRLFPTAYPDDPERDAGYHALVRDELLEKRFGSLDLVQSTLAALESGPVELDGDELSAWMRAVNDLRLVLGTRLDVGEDDQHLDLDPDDPDAVALQVYDYLGMLVATIVDALAGDL